MNTKLSDIENKINIIQNSLIYYTILLKNPRRYNAEGERNKYNFECAIKECKTQIFNLYMKRIDIISDIEAKNTDLWPKWSDVKNNGNTIYDMISKDSVKTVDKEKILKGIKEGKINPNAKLIKGTYSTPIETKDGLVISLEDFVRKYCKLNENGGYHIDDVIKALNENNIGNKEEIIHAQVKLDYTKKVILSSGLETTLGDFMEVNCEIKGGGAQIVELAKKLIEFKVQNMKELVEYLVKEKNKFIKKI